MSKYSDNLIRAMVMLSENKHTIFLGQCIKYSGHIMFSTLRDVPESKKIEMPVAEEMQMGMSIGLALGGFIPISIYPRMDFLVLALNQLVNHLDKIEQTTSSQWKPKVIIRTMVGSTKPMYPGIQHCQDHTEAILSMLTNINISILKYASDMIPAYRYALASSRSTILIEAPPKREGYED